MCQSPNKSQQQPVGSLEQRVPFPQSKSNWSTTHTISLLDLPTLSLSQRVFINHPSNSDSIQVSSRTYLTGSTMGVVWVPMDSYVDIRPNKHTYYSAAGVLEWRLLSFTVYRQAMFFEGEDTHLNRDLSDLPD